jgi:aspartate/methionine/tyrosine aminotransferase
VYEHLTFDGWKHIPLMTLPGMRERCMRIGSAGRPSA